MSADNPTTVSESLPSIFPTRRYLEISDRIQAQKAGYLEEYRQFHPAWTAVSRRYLTCFEHSNLFTENVANAGTSPTEYPDRYVQDREAFEFFVAGASCVENFCYGVYSIGAIVSPEYFPLRTKRDLRGISPESTKERFRARFHKCQIAESLSSLTSNVEYNEWRRIRNALIHHSAPARIFDIGVTTEWRFADFTIEISETTTSNRLTWLSEMLNVLHDSTSMFLDDHSL